MTLVQPFPYTYRVLDLNIENGFQAFKLPISAESLFYNWGTATLEIALNSPSEQRIKLRPKQKIEAPMTDFYLWVDARDETIQILLANPKSIDIGGGEVRVVTDTGYFDSIAQGTFILGTTPAQVVGQFSCIGLYNPSSNYHLMLDTIDVAINCLDPNATDFLLFHRHNADLTPPLVPQNKFLAGQASIANFGGFNVAALPGTEMGRIRVQNAIRNEFKFFRQPVIEPGQMFYVTSTGTNEINNAMFQWFEKPFVD